MTLLKSHLFKYQSHVSAALVLGGVDLHGPHLYTIYPHGSTDSLPFCTMGSGSLNAMAVFEVRGRGKGGERQGKKGGTKGMSFLPSPFTLFSLFLLSLTYTLIFMYHISYPRPTTART
jgi:hypothetical protein